MSMNIFLLIQGTPGELQAVLTAISSGEPVTAPAVLAPAPLANGAAVKPLIAPQTAPELSPFVAPDLDADAEQYLKDEAGDKGEPVTAPEPTPETAPNKAPRVRRTVAEIAADKAAEEAKKAGITPDVNIVQVATPPAPLPPVTKIPSLDVVRAEFNQRLTAKKPELKALLGKYGYDGLTNLYKGAGDANILAFYNELVKI